jgi:hypothetical protein
VISRRETRASSPSSRSLMLESQTVYDLLLLPGAGESFEIELLRAAAA